MAFTEKFKKYQDAVDKLPGGWKKVGDATEESGSRFVDMTAAILAQNELLAKSVIEATKLGTAAHSTQSTWSKIAATTKSIAGNIASATEKLLKWSAITGAVSALAGLGGGLFGLDRLASSTYSGSRSASGLGLPVGALRSFGVNLGRVVDPNSFLSGIATGLSDVTSDQYRALAGLGLNPQQFGDTGQAAVAALPRIQQLLQSRPRELIGSTLQAYQLNSIISGDEARRLRSTSPGDLGEFIKQFQRDRQALSIPEKIQKQWTDLSVQLQRAGVQIETVLVSDLHGLAPQLDRLSKAFVGAIDAFLKSPEVKKWIDLAATGLEKFANYVSKPQFAQDVEKFMTNVGRLASSIYTAASWIADKLNSLTGGGIGKSAGIGAIIGGALGLSFGGIPGAALGAGLGSGYGAWAGGLGSTGDEWWKSVHKDRSKEAPTWNDFKQWWKDHTPSFIGSAEAATKSSFLQALEPGEGGNAGYNALYSGGSAAGLPTDAYGFPIWAGRQGPAGISHAAGAYQFEPATWDKEARRLGLSDFSPESQNLAAWDLASTTYNQKTGHQLSDDLGRGNNASIISALNSTWPSINQSFLARLEQYMRNSHMAMNQSARRMSRENRYRGKSNLEIRNSTGGSATITGSALATSYG